MVNDWLTSFDDPLALGKAFRESEALIRRHSRTFFLATALLPSRQRSAIRALYAFCRATDDLSDREGALPGDLDRWQAQVQAPLEYQADPVLIAWTAVREAHAVNRRFETELIEGVRLDLYAQRYGTWADLERYCYAVASTVGLLSIPIIGLRGGVSLEQAQLFAIRLGVALQLTNILRDVGEDASRGRMYLPLEDLHTFGLREEDILHGVYDGRFVALMRFEIARARELYRQALPGIALLSPTARPAVAAAALMYRAILDEIEAIGCQVHTHRAHTSGWKKAGLLPEILWMALTLPVPPPASVPAPLQAEMPAQRPAVRPAARPPQGP
jgi:phytoene synthase